MPNTAEGVDPNSLDKRLYESGSDGDRRLPAWRDRDRVLYTSEFRRLTRVTQVASATEQLLIHNRSTHSSRVEQVAAALVNHHDRDPTLIKDEVLGTASMWRAAAAGLAHDIGHPPFGHVGEDVLNAELLCRDHLVNPTRSAYGRDDAVPDAPRRPATDCKCILADGFEGNAQSFRILTKLAVRGYSRQVDSKKAGPSYRTGLNLTRGTLAACTKYPWLRGDYTEKPKKWGAFDSEAAELAFALGAEHRRDHAAVLAKANGTDTVRAIEAEFMDWADDITYAVHDMDDFFRLGLIPLDQLWSASTERDEFLRYATSKVKVPSTSNRAALVDYVEHVLSWLPTRPFASRAEDLAALNSLTSDLIQQFIENTTVLKTPKRETARAVPTRLQIDNKARFLNEVLMQLTWYYVIDNPSLATMQEGQRKVLSELFRVMHESAREFYISDSGNEAKKRRLPEQLRFFVDLVMEDPGAQSAYNEDQQVARGVTDFIANLTDLGAFRLHARMIGDADVSILEPSIAY